MLESCTCATIREIAIAQKINETYVDQVLRLTLLAPQLVEAIRSGRQPAQLQLAALMKFSSRMERATSVLVVKTLASIFYGNSLFSKLLHQSLTR